MLIDEFVLQTPISLSSGGMKVDITLRQLLAAADPVIGPQDQAAAWAGPQPVARLVADVVVGAAEISTDRDLAKAGWPASGAADLDFETFTYASLAGNVFTGVTGIGKLHSSGQWAVGLSITEPDVRGGCNSVTLRYAQDSISGDYAAEASAEATAEQEKYGKLHRDIDAPLVHGQVHAADLAEVIVERDKVPPAILSVSCYLDVFPLEAADKVSLFTLWSKLFYFDGELVRAARSFGAPGRVTKIRLDLRGRRVPTQWIELSDSREFPAERDALDELHLGGWGMPWGSPWECLKTRGRYADGGR